MPLHIQLMTYSPIIGLAIAIFMYVRYQASANSGRPLPIFVFFPIVAVAGFVAFHAGKFAGIWIACALPEEPGNLCGLFGYFVTGPLAAAVVQVIVAALLIRVA